MPTDKMIASAEKITNLPRRTFLRTAAGLGGLAMAQSTSARAAVVRTDFSTLPPYGNGTLPAGIRSRQIANVNGMTVHILEAGYETRGRPAVLLLHGFPELAYSWRKVMPSLAAAGYHVIAPDQRGYGRTIGWDDSYDADPDSFRILNMTRDAIGLVYALGDRSVAIVVGHDAGAPVASWSALIRPDIFRSVTIMSSPFEGAPSLPFDTANGAPYRARQLRTTSLIANLRSSSYRGNTIKTISAPVASTTTCYTRRKACTPSSAPITSARAPTTKAIIPILLRRVPQRKWRKFRLIT
jgi:pimeloyl-ACP methyl ester carboxylesterase